MFYRCVLCWTPHGPTTGGDRRCSSCQGIESAVAWQKMGILDKTLRSDAKVSGVRLLRSTAPPRGEDVPRQGVLRRLRLFPTDWFAQCLPGGRVLTVPHRLDSVAWQEVPRAMGTGCSRASHRAGGPGRATPTPRNWSRRLSPSTRCSERTRPMSTDGKTMEGGIALPLSVCTMNARPTRPIVDQIDAFR